MILINKDIQVKIDEVCAKYECGRAFLRPSGTEDVCRLYAEAKNLEDIAKIEKEISEYVIAHKELN
jgi:phosphoacetylglucosamine mutase